MNDIIENKWELKGRFEKENRYAYDKNCEENGVGKEWSIPFQTGGL